MTGKVAALEEVPEKFYINGNTNMRRSNYCNENFFCLSSKFLAVVTHFLLYLRWNMFEII